MCVCNPSVAVRIMFLCMCVCVCVCVQVYSLCANSSTAVDVFGSALQPLVSAPPSFNITFIGQGDPGLCSSFVQAVFNLTNCSSSGDNCAGPRYIAPPVQGEYVVRGGGGVVRVYSMCRDHAS